MNLAVHHHQITTLWGGFLYDEAITGRLSRPVQAACKCSVNNKQAIKLMNGRNQIAALAVTSGFTTHPHAGHGDDTRQCFGLVWDVHGLKQSIAVADRA